MFLVVGVHYDHRLGVLGVAKITMSICACCMCVAYLSVKMCVSVLSCGIRVVFAYK